MPIKADHEIEVKILGDEAVPSQPIDKIEMKVGETVRILKSARQGQDSIPVPFSVPE